MNKKDLKIKIINIVASMLLISFMGFENLCFSKKAYAEIKKANIHSLKNFQKLLACYLEK